MPEGVEEIDYFHIELETHEVIYAEGAAAETLLLMMTVKRLLTSSVSSSIILRNESGSTARTLRL
jgi:hypothetical protein